MAWILDGLEITVASAVAGALSQADTLHLSSTAVGAVASVITQEDCQPVTEQSTDD